jgi:hypothetical protein
VTSGSIHAADATAAGAQSAMTTAYNDLVSQGCTQDLSGQDLGGKTLTPGVYCFTGSAQLTGTLTLNAQGNANAVFIFKIGSTLTTASGANVVLINSGQACNVFFQVTSSATLGTSSHLEGTIIALQSITLTTGASVSGHAMARNGAVTLDTNTVGVTTCTAAAPCGVISQLPAALPAGMVASAYSQPITASGGTGPYTFAVTAGALPAGVTLTSAGALAGTPTTAGTYPVTITSTDAASCTVSVAYSLVIAAAAVCPVITLSPATLPTGRVGPAYSQPITGSGGTAPYVFTITSGTLPAGLTLTTAGVLAGTPTTAGTTSVTIRGTDANGCFASVTYSIVIAAAVSVCPVITLAPATLPAAVVGTAYSQTITGSGGTAPYVFTVTAGALPTGLTLTTAGLLAGTPTTNATSTFTIRGTDANGCFAEIAYTVIVSTAVPTLPQVFAWLLALGLVGAGVMQLRRRTLGNGRAE